MPVYFQKISKFILFAVVLVFSLGGLFLFRFSVSPTVYFSSNLSLAAATNTTIELLSPTNNASTSKPQPDFQARVTDPGDSNAWVAAYFYIYQATGTAYRLVAQDWASTLIKAAPGKIT